MWFRQHLSFHSGFTLYNKNLTQTQSSTTNVNNASADFLVITPGCSWTTTHISLVGYNSVCCVFMWHTSDYSRLKDPVHQSLLSNFLFGKWHFMFYRWKCIMVQSLPSHQLWCNVMWDAVKLKLIQRLTDVVAWKRLQRHSFYNPFIKTESSGSGLRSAETRSDLM